MPSEVQICNVALARVGHNQRIDSLEEASVAAELCNLFYADCRDQVLREYDWPFATRRVALADIGSPPTNWSYQYRLPVDCLRARELAVPGLRVPSADQRLDYELAYSGDGVSVLANQPQAELIYTARIENPTVFDPLFASALSWRMATELALSLMVSNGAAADAARSYRVAVAEAAAAAFNESADHAPESELIRVRR